MNKAVLKVAASQVEKVEMVRLEAKALRLDAPEFYWSCLSTTLAVIAGGCGPGQLGDDFVPDDPFQLRLAPACQIHDTGYYLIKSCHPQAWRREQEDHRFLGNMVDVWRRQVPRPPLWRRLRQLWAVIEYYQWVSRLGGVFCET